MNGLIIDILKRGANEIWRLGLTEGQLGHYARYAELLVEWNMRFNLTRLITPPDIAVKHFLDSLAVLHTLVIPQNTRVIDIGTGAGLPGLALKIARPDMHLTLLDSTAKKLTFCRAVADELGLSDVTTLHARAEDAGKLAGHAHAYDLALARAVAPLEKLLPWATPFLRPGGSFVALKGVSVDDEIATARPFARRHGLRLEPLPPFALPESQELLQRKIIICSTDLA